MSNVSNFTFFKKYIVTLIMSTDCYYFQGTHDDNLRNRRSFIIGSGDPLTINVIAFAHPGMPCNSFPIRHQRWFPRRHLSLHL